MLSTCVDGDAPDIDQPLDLLVTRVGLTGGLNDRQVADAARVSRTDLKGLFITGYAENANCIRRAGTPQSSPRHGVRIVAPKGGFDLGWRDDG
jgi:hypothetical protein